MSVRQMDGLKSMSQGQLHFKPSERATTNLKILEEAVSFGRQTLSQQIKGG